MTSEISESEVIRTRFGSEKIANRDNCSPVPRVPQNIGVLKCRSIG